MKKENMVRVFFRASFVKGVQRFKKLSADYFLPMDYPATYFILIINLIKSIQVYDKIQIMTQGCPGGSTTTFNEMIEVKGL